MKKRIATLFVFLLIACLMMTGCSIGENVTETEPTSSPEIEEVPVDTEPTNDEDGMYTYFIGEIEVKLRTRVEDYITDDGYFRFTDLANDLGWTRSESKWGPVATVYCTVDDETVAFTYDPGMNDIIEEIGFGVVRTVSPLDFPYKSVLKFDNFDEDDEHKTYVIDEDYIYGVRMKVHFSHIVATAFILENYAQDRSREFLLGYFELTGNDVWSVYE